MVREAAPGAAGARSIERHPFPRHVPGVEGPRERLHARGRDALGTLSEIELLALVLGSGTSAHPLRRVSEAVLDACGGLRGLSTASAGELRSIPGVGPAKAASLLASCEIGRRIAAHRLRIGDPMRGPTDIHRHFYSELRDASQESFIALLLNGRHQVMGERTVSRGTLTASLVHPREVFRSALREAAAAIVLVHNHPSGDPMPSAEDREVTRRLCSAGTLLGVRVLDHVIVAERGFYSFSEAGELNE